MKKISIIVAIAANNAIGKDNQLLWHISNDLKRFKRITQGHPVIMGKKTFESLPKAPLPNRINIVITDVPGETFEGCTTVYSIEEALEHCNKQEESFIIGGGSIYKQFMPHANKLYITRVNRNFEADTFFPEVDKNEWKLIEQEDVKDDQQNDFTYSFLTYVK
ncbi:MAG: dihydrofolate reductase [Bacteroidota bacterium]|nr:dihydrofolate reductase [Bacteroidota bacterium]